MRDSVRSVRLTIVGLIILLSTALSNTPSTAASKPRSFTVVTTGDILLHERMWNQAIADGKNGEWDFFPQLSRIGRLIKPADLALCHLETPLAPLGGRYTGYPVFRSPPQIVSAIKRIGFDMCDQTSNHTFDDGQAGVIRTLNYFDQAGIAHTGTYRSEADSKKPLIMSVQTGNGIVKVGIIAFTYGFNGIPYPNGNLWLANQTRLDRVLSAAKASRAAGADVVIAKIHWGTEYAHYPNDNQLTLAKKIATSGLVDLIDGDHTHSVEPIQKIGRMWVAYSHGNLLANQLDPSSAQFEGVVNRWTFTEQPNHRFQVTKAEFAPTLITHTLPDRVLDAHYCLKTGKWVSTTKQRLQIALTRTSKIIRSMGAPVSLAD